MGLGFTLEMLRHGGFQPYTHMFRQRLADFDIFSRNANLHDVTSLDLGLMCGFVPRPVRKRRGRYVRPSPPVNRA
jgi:hypothetical protein